MDTETRWSRRQYWLAVAVGLICVIIGGLIGLFGGLALVIWLFEGGDALGELLKPGPIKVTAARILGLAIGAGIGTRAGLRASGRLMRKLGLTEQESPGSRKAT